MLPGLYGVRDEETLFSMLEPSESSIDAVDWTVYTSCAPKLSVILDGGDEPNVDQLLRRSDIDLSKSLVDASPIGYLVQPIWL